MEVLILIPEAIYKTFTFTGMGYPVRFLYTALLLIEIYLVYTSSAFGQTIRKFSYTTGRTETKLHVAPPWDRGKMESLFK